MALMSSKICLAISAPQWSRGGCAPMSLAASIEALISSLSLTSGKGGNSRGRINCWIWLAADFPPEKLRDQEFNLFLVVTLSILIAAIMISSFLTIPIFQDLVPCKIKHQTRGHKTDDATHTYIRQEVLGKVDP